MKTKNWKESFKPGTTFFTIWLVVFIPVLYLTAPWSLDLPWFSKLACIILFPFFTTIVIYRPIAFIHKIIQSGKEGRKILRIFTSCIIGVLISLAITRWAIIRWHNQILMIDRLHWYGIIHNAIKDDPADAREMLEELMVFQWDKIEYYIEHPLKLSPRMPGSLGFESNITFWESLILPFYGDELANARDFSLSQIGVTRINSNLHVPESEPNPMSSEQNN